MKVLVLSKYGRMAASARHRFVAYAPHLAEASIELTFAPLLDDDYLSRILNEQAAPRRLIVQSYFKRVGTLATVWKYDLLIIQYELFPYLPPWFEQLLARMGVPYVVDYDDAIFHMYDEHPSSLVRHLLSDKVARIISGARGVMAGSEYLAAYARKHNENVHLIPTVIDLDRYRTVKSHGVRDAFTIGWIGSPSTAPYLSIVSEVISQLGRESPTRLLVIGGGPPDLQGVEVVAKKWSESTEVDDLLECDVGIMPLPDESWARGKCAFKIIQYLACGLPVVASDVGANRDVVTPETGLLARSSEDWLQALRTFRDVPEKRQHFGRAGRVRCEQLYSLQSRASQVIEVLTEAAR